MFGHSTLTATDIAVAAGMADIGDPRLVTDGQLDPGIVQHTVAKIREMLEAAIDQVKVHRKLVFIRLQRVMPYTYSKKTRTVNAFMKLHKNYILNLLRYILF